MFAPGNPSSIFPRNAGDPQARKRQPDTTTDEERTVILAIGTGRPGARAAALSVITAAVRVLGVPPVAKACGLSARSLAALLNDPQTAPESTWSSLSTGLQGLGEQLV